MAVLTVEKPVLAGASGATVLTLAPGDVLDLSAIADEQISLVRAGNALVIDFADGTRVVILDAYAPDAPFLLASEVVLGPDQAIDPAEFNQLMSVRLEPESYVGDLGDDGGVSDGGVTEFPEFEIASFSQPAGAPETFSIANRFGSTPDRSGDDDGGIDQEGVTVGAVNQAPVANDDAVATDEDVPVEIDVLANDSDPDGDPLTVTILDGVMHGTLTENADGTFTYEPDPEFSGVDSFTYELSDGQGGVDEATVTIDIAPVNDAPTEVVLTPVLTEIAENTDATGGIKVADIAVTDDALGSYVLTPVGADAGAFQIRGTELFFTGPAPDFESQASYQVAVEVDDASVGADPDATSALFTLDVTDANEAPTEVVLTPVLTEIAENTDATGGIKVADIAVTDDALGSYVLTPVGADAGAFQIRGTELFFTGPAPDFESQASYQVAVEVDDASVGADPDATSALFTLDVTDANEAPTEVVLTPVLTEIAENTDATGGIKVADIAVTDDALGSYVLTPVGADAGAFQIRGTELFFTGPAPDFEAQASYQVAVEVDDAAVGADPDATSALFTLDVTDANEAPTEVVLTPVLTEIAENTDATGGIKVADIAVTDDALGSYVLTPVGADAGAFQIRGTELFFTGPAPDFESQASYQVAVEVDDASVGADPDATSALFTLDVTDANEAPTEVVLTPVLTEIAENTDATGGIKVADIAVTDDALGSYVLTPVGADAGAFQIRGTELFFTGPAPDFESQASYQVAVEVDDASVGADPDATSALFTLDVTDANEAPTEVVLTPVLTEIAENTDATGGIKVADIAVTDDALGSYVLTPVGADAGAFQIRGTELFFTGPAPDFESQASYQVAVEVDDASVGADPDATSALFTLDVTDANEAPTEVVLTPVLTEIAENTDATGGIKVADIAVTDDALGSYVLTPVGADAGAFQIRGTELFFTGPAPDFESQASYQVAVEVDDASVGADPDATSALFTLDVTDANEAPTEVVLTPVLTEIAENTDATGGIKVADIAVTDDALGSYVLTPVGADAGAFQIRGTELFFTGPAPDFESQASYQVAVEVDDASVGADPDATSALFTLDVTDVNDDPIALDDDFSVEIRENLITNGSFEDTTGLDAASFGFSGATLPGWSFTGGSFVELVNGSLRPQFPNAPDGDLFLDTEADVDLTVSQTVSVEAGVDYTLSFSAAMWFDSDGLANNSLEVRFGGELISTIDATDLPNLNEFVDFTFEVTGGMGDGSDILSFTSLDAGLGDDRETGVALDNVSLLRSPLTGNVLANDTDVDSPTLMAALDTDVSNGTLVLNSDGSFEYTPDIGFAGTDSFTYIVSDGEGGSDGGSVEITVGPGAVAPMAFTFSATSFGAPPAPMETDAPDLGGLAGLLEEGDETTADLLSLLDSAFPEEDGVSIKDYVALSTRGEDLIVQVDVNQDGDFGNDGEEAAFVFDGVGEAASLLGVLETPTVLSEIAQIDAAAGAGA